MWLLDHNIPLKIKAALEKKGIQADTAYARGWDKLENGELVTVCVNAGFKMILTRDRRFQRAAQKNFELYPELALVLVTILQNDAKSYLQDFETAWRKAPIKPIPGQLLEWPKQK